ncbi:hypothetical protein AM609_12375 [Actinomyces sp. oral taxon 414]|uniref:hypothetical protein n=1 Tax=Actinomyces sp. oral taxon 414 TaxID=712122 RepID=UPI0006AF50D5|nr:hypothetical protein [Actinomyces sp. oral taxon 414]ALD00052.1 hypothetical protein AM609_12375 [Actinomyces sp. oral taxon 414]
MPSPYLDDDGEPRYGRRASPEELAAIRREQGIDAPAAGAPPVGGADSGAGRAPGPGDAEDNPYARRGARPRPGGALPPGGLRRRRRGRRTLVVGLILLIVVPLVLLGGAMALVLEGSPSAGTALTGSGEVYLDAGVASALYSLSADAPLSECSITGPTGQAVTTEQPAGAGDLPSYVSFTPPATGRYTVSCPTGTAVVVGPAMRMDRLLPASFMILAALGSGIAGLVVGAVGLVRVLRRG